MISDKRLAAKLLEQKGLRVEGFSKEKRARSKTPDFKVYCGTDFAFFCEVKTASKDSWISQCLDAVGPGVIVSRAGPDPTYNRISKKINEAVKQFDAVNPEMAYPNVLAFVNHDEDSGVKDLRSVYTGEVITDSGRRLQIFRKFSEGRIKDKKLRIHLFIWVDDFNGEPNSYFIYNLDSQEYLERLCSYFGSDPDSIRRSS